jgi:hypothetical protein
MNETIWQIIKLVLCAFVVIALQVAVLKEVTDIAFNLPLVAIISIASFSNLEMSIYSAAIFIASISLLSYDNVIYWSYLLIAFITNQFNPKNLEDKFLVAAFYCSVFSPILEIIYTPVREDLINKCITTTLINLASLVPVYFLLKLTLSQKKKALY